MPLPQYDRASDLEQTQQRLKKVFDPLLRVPLLDGRLIEDVTFVSGVPQSVAHGLGRRPLGYFGVGMNAEMMPYEFAARDTKFLNLQSSVTGTISLWVF